MHSILSRLQSVWQVIVSQTKNIWQSIRRGFQKLVTAAIATPTRCVTLSLFVLALFVRLYQLDTALIGADSAPYLGAYREALVATPWTTATSQLLLGLLSALMSSLTGTLAILGILNSLSVALAAWVTSRWFGVRVGALTGLLLCFNPWGILASRTIGPAALLLPAGVLVLWGLELAFSEKRPGGWVLAFSISGLACGLHAIGLLLAGLCLLMCLVFAKRTSWRHVGVGILWGLLAAIPPLHALNIVGWAQNGLAGQATVAERLDAIIEALGGGNVLESAFAGSGAISLPPALQNGLQVWGWLVLAALPIAAYLALWAWAHWRKKLDAGEFAAIALAGISTTVGLLLLPDSAEPRLYYGLLSFDMVCVALMIDALIPRMSVGQPARVNAGMLLFIAVTLVFGVQTYTTLTYNSQADTDANTTEELPLRYWQQLASMVERCVGESTSDRVWILDSAQGDTLLVPEIVAYETDDVVLVEADANTLPVALDEATLVLAVPDRQAALESTSTACGRVLLPGESKAVWLDELAVVNVTTLPLADETEARTMALGITYLGCQTISNDADAEITIYWRRMPEANSKPIALYLDGTLIGQITPGELAPESCATLATTLDTQGLLKTHTLWSDNGEGRVELDTITITDL